MAQSRDYSVIIFICQFSALLVVCSVAAKGGKSAKGFTSEDEECSSDTKTAVELKKIGAARLQGGSAAGAVTCFKEALVTLEQERFLPSWAQEKGEIGVLLGDALEAAQDIEASAAQFRKVMAEFPTSPVPPFKLANQLREAEKFHESIALYKKAVALAPTFINARVNLGMSFRGVKDLDSSIQSYREALEYAPERADVHVNLGVALDAAGKPEEARAAYELSIKLNPKLYQAYFNLGVVLFESLKLKEEGIAMYHKSLQIEPNFADAYHTLGTSHTNLGRYNDARRYLNLAVAMRPSDGRFHNSLGILADAVGDSAGALAAYQASISTSSSPAAIINAAKVLNSQSRFAEAEQLCFKAIKLDPAYGEAYCQLGDVYKDGEQIGLALKAYQQGISLSPNYDAGFCNYFYTATFACYWEDRGAHVRKLREVMRKYLNGSDPLAHECVQPFQSLAYPLEPEELREIARFHANKALYHVRGIAGPGFVPFTVTSSLLHLVDARTGASSYKLRVGWISADYKDHPVVKDLVHVFSMFQVNRFDTFCFALNPAGPGVGWETSGWHDGGGPGPHRLWRDRAAQHCAMVDLSSIGDVEAAASINQQRIHIMFNIQGYTQGERNEILALQPAPIQVAYKGFVGTHGADYIKHIVADRVVSPPEFESHFLEKMMYMPHTYVVNDYRQWHTETALPPSVKITRSEYGLPEWPRVIYCNFNQQYKIDAATLRSWVQILQKVPDSILWLIRFGTSNAAETSLVEQAVKLGLDDGSRIVFTDPVARKLHLHVKSLAHVFIDTPQYNGHGTATDALWAKIPLVTFPVRKMASRAAASFTAAAGGEGKATLVRNLRDYVDVAVQLGDESNEELLKDLQSQLGETRFSSPMFDTKRWVLGLQSMMRMLWESRLDGNSRHTVLADRFPVTPP